MFWGQKRPKKGRKKRVKSARFSCFFFDFMSKNGVLCLTIDVNHDKIKIKTLRRRRLGKIENARWTIHKTGQDKSNRMHGFRQCQHASGTFVLCCGVCCPGHNLVFTTSCVNGWPFLWKVNTNIHKVFPMGLMPCTLVPFTKILCLCFSTTNIFKGGAAWRSIV